MKQCPSEQKLFTYFLGDLDEVSQIEVDEHLGLCEACQKALAEWQPLSRQLDSYNRPTPTRQWMNSYAREIQSHFNDQSVLSRFWTWILESSNWVFNSPAWGMRLAKTMAILMVGIFLGKMAFQSSNINEETPAPTNILLLSLSADDRQSINHFFNESEIWLLTISNQPQDEDASDLEFNQKIAKNLLTKTSCMEGMVSDFEHKRLNAFLNSLEHLLLEITNASGQEMTDIVDDIRGTIKDTGLVIEVQQLQKMLEQPYRYDT